MNNLKKLTLGEEPNKYELFFRDGSILVKLNGEDYKLVFLDGISPPRDLKISEV